MTNKNSTITLTTESYSFERFKRAIENFKRIEAQKRQNAIVAKKATKTKSASMNQGK